MNTFGRNITLTTFGESHGIAMGGVIDGFPPGVKLDFNLLHEEMEKRRPGSSPLVSARREVDKPEFLSGLTPDGITLGSPIAFIVRNNDARPADYDGLANAFRPNHADFTYMQKYGIRDCRGGGRSSARETVNWVVAGALVMQWLSRKGISIESGLVRVGKVGIPDLIDLAEHPELSLSSLISADMRAAMEEEILMTKRSGDSIGGKVACIVSGLPPGVGSPVADKLQASLAKAMMSINAAKGFEYGIGFKAAESSGFQTADRFCIDESGTVRTSSNFSGGIQGGITNGMSVYFSVAFKPTPSVPKPLKTVTQDGEETVISAGGRHDPCVALRAVPVVKAMAALVIADHLMEVGR